MDSDSATHITDSTQDEMPIEEAIGRPALEQWLNDPDLPRYPNMPQIDDSPSTTNTNLNHTWGHLAPVQQTYTTLAEATIGPRGGSRIGEPQSNSFGASHDGVNFGTVIASARNTNPSQRAANYPTVLDFFLETSVGIGSDMVIPPQTYSPRNIFSSELENTFAIRPNDPFSSRRIGRGVFSDSSIRLFEVTAVLYYCTFCNFRSPSYLLWRRHEREQHLLSDDAVADTSTEDLKCYFCGEDAANINERAEHIARHFHWQGFTKADWDACKAAAVGSQPSRAFPPNH